MDARCDEICLSYSCHPSSFNAISPPLPSNTNTPILPILFRCRGLRKVHTFFYAFRFIVIVFCLFAVVLFCLFVFVISLFSCCFLVGFLFVWLGFLGGRVYPVLNIKLLIPERRMYRHPKHIRD